MLAVLFLKKKSAKIMLVSSNYAKSYASTIYKGIPLLVWGVWGFGPICSVSRASSVAEYAF